jgi:xanthine dehydrogenase FAD-binding subunit
VSIRESANGFSPKSLAEALEILQKEPAIPVAGGTDLMVRHRRHGPLPIQLDAAPVFIGHLAELQGIIVTDSDLHIGAATTLSAIGAHPQVPPGLAAALGEFASPAIRNAGTMGGNICNASPAGDTLPYLYATDAQVVLTSRSGDRTVPIAEFVTGPGQTALGAGELMTTIIIPRRPASFVFYRKVAPRRSNALSKLSVYAEAGLQSADGQSAVTGFRLAVGAVAPTVVRLPDTEKLIEGATATEILNLSGELIAAYQARIKPIDDQRSTAIYRRNTALTLIRHLLEYELPTFLEQS